MKVGKYYIIGAEREDIVQEGLIGLFKAIKIINQISKVLFKNFANMYRETTNYCYKNL